MDLTGFVIDYSLPVMKKFLIITASIIALIFIALTLIPIFFKDDIKTALEEEIAKSVNAEVVFDDFNLSLISNFPNVTAGVNNLGVINREPFPGEILFAVEKFEVEVDLSSLIFGDQIAINGIVLHHPEVFIKVMEDGTANYDIAHPASDTAMAVAEEPVAEEAPAAFSIGIDHWEINQGHVVYQDFSTETLVEIQGLEHSGSGDFTQDLFDLATYTKIDTFDLSLGGVSYMADRMLEVDMILEISDQYQRYTFKENTVSVNDFALGFDGFFAMAGDAFDMDITFASKDNSFKSLLSLVPGVFTEGFEDIKTEGMLSFAGFIKGKMDSLTLPAYQVNLEVEDAMFQYPELPTPVSNINIAVLVDNKDGIVEHTMINVKKCHLDFGQNPIDAKILVENLSNYKMNADVNAKLNLAELTTMFPMEGLTMRGVFDLQLNANGVYDSLRHMIPAINAHMSLTDGYVKTGEFPIPMENMHFTALAENKSGRMAETRVVVDDFNMVMDNERFNASLTFENLNDYTWDLTANGGIDLEKITQIFPMEGMSLSGKIKADIKTKGKMSDLEAERYEKLPTSGTLTANDFQYEDASLPYDVTIKSAEATFDPRGINLNSYQGTIGKSDMTLKGNISNYIGYLFGEDQTLKGTLSYSGRLLDLNEFMEEEGSEDDSPPAVETAATTGETGESGVIPVPEDIDFVLNANINTVKLTNLTMSNADGKIIVRNGVANIDGLKFGMLGGQFVVNGNYDSRDIEHPKYDFDLDIQNMSIQQSFTSLSMVQGYAPIAQFINGDFSTDFKISGELDDEMMPDLATVNAGGLLKIAQAAIQDTEKVKLVSSITSLANLDKGSVVTFKDVLMSATIENGRMSTDPFDIKIGDYKTTVAGSTGLDQSLGYDLDMLIPAGNLGKEFNQFVSQYAGGSGTDNDLFPVKLKVGGTFTNPKVQMDLSAAREQLKTTATTKAKEKAGEQAQELLKNVKDDKTRQLIGSLLGTEPEPEVTTETTAQPTADTTKTEEKPVEDLQKKAEEKAREAIQNLFKRKKKN